MLALLGKADLEPSGAVGELAEDVLGGNLGAGHPGDLAEGQDGAGGARVVGALGADHVAQGLQLGLQHADRETLGARAGTQRQDVEPAALGHERRQFGRRAVARADGDVPGLAGAVAQDEHAGARAARLDRNLLGRDLLVTAVEAHHDGLAGDVGLDGPSDPEAIAREDARRLAVDLLQRQLERAGRRRRRRRRHGRGRRGDRWRGGGRRRRGRRRRGRGLGDGRGGWARNQRDRDGYDGGGDEATHGRAHRIRGRRGIRDLARERSSPGPSEPATAAAPAR